MEPHEATKIRDTREHRRNLFRIVGTQRADARRSVVGRLRNAASLQRRTESVACRDSIAR